MTVLALGTTISRLTLDILRDSARNGETQVAAESSGYKHISDDFQVAINATYISVRSLKILDTASEIVEPRAHASSPLRGFPNP